MARENKNYDLEISSFLLVWMVLKGYLTLLKSKHIQIDSDNTPTVS